MSGGIALSVIVPALNEFSALPQLLAELADLHVETEVVVVDGGSTDGTAAAAAAVGARVLHSAPGRGTQLRLGAATARGRVLCILHADVRLPPATRRRLETLSACCADGEVYAFTLRIAGGGWRYRLVEWGTARRAELGRLPYGDQGLVLTRATYAAAGGFSDIPLMEDVELMLRLRRQARVHVLAEPVTVSARRWERDGLVRRTLRNWLLLAGHLAGIAPATLARAYRPHAG